MNGATRASVPTYLAVACQDDGANGDINPVYDGNEQGNEKVDDPKSRYKKVKQPNPSHTHQAATIPHGTSDQPDHT